ncbi:MAG: efflux RND transporter periplasmic adaptor subunit [Phycisphaerae bacterium]
MADTSTSGWKRRGARQLTLLAAGLLAGAAGTRYWMTLTSAHDSVAPSASSGHDDHQHDGEQRHEQGVVRLSAKAIQSSGIEVFEAGPGRLEQTITLPGEVRLNADRVAHIVPRVSGMVREVRKNIGETVTPGEVIAILDSRELADAKAADLAAASRHDLAKASLERIAKLFEKKIAPEEELLKARQALAETNIDHRTAEAKLHALGLTQEQVQRLHEEKDADYSRYEIKAPFSGAVIEKHLSLGEVVSSETTCFILADLSTVWVNITVYAQDVGRISVGQAVQIKADAFGQAASGAICYVAPVASESTRTVYARVDLPNRDRQWRPGTFVTASIVLDQDAVGVLVPNDAIQRLNNESVVFVVEKDGFEPRTVKLGRLSHTHAEIADGLRAGERFVGKGAVVLKGELGKHEAAHEH